MAAKRGVARELLELLTAHGPVTLTNEQLAEQWDVTPKSVRECVVSLEARGVIITAYGKPTGSSGASNRTITLTQVTP